MLRLMIRLTTVAVLAVIWWQGVAIAAPTQSLRSGAYFCGTDGSCMWYKPSDPDWVFQRFTYIMGYAECQGNIAEWRSKSPGCRLVVYTTGTDMPAYKSTTSNSYVRGRKSTYVRNRMVQLGEMEEKAYLHFYNDTKLTNWNGAGYDTVLVRGTYSMTIAAKDSISRVPNSYVSLLFASGNTYSGDTRLAPNFTNPKLRLAYKEYITQAFNSTATQHWPGITGYWDGIYFDNYGPGALQGSHLASGGLVVETGTTPSNLLTFGTDAYGAWGWNWMLAFGREIRDTLRTSHLWSADNKKKILAYNVGVSFKNAYMYPDSTGADALNFEFAFDPTSSANNSVHRLENLYAHDSIAALNGATFFWCSRPRTELATKREAIYNNLCFYYVARGESTWIYMRPDPGNAYGVFLNTGFDTLAWIPAMGYDIGRPAGHYQLAASGSSPDKAGAMYKVWYRDYQQGRVYTRPKDDLDAVWGSSSTPVTVNLGGSYKQLKPNGTFGATVSSISLRASEGAILIPTTVGQCTTPPTIPVLNSPANGANVTTTPTLCVNNSTQTNCSQPITYHFQVSAQSNFSVIAAENPSAAQGASTTCWTVTPALATGKTFYWRVRAGNGTSTSDWSSSRTFVTPNSPPSVPVLSSPANGATVTTTQPSLVIQNSTDPEGVTPTYHFQVSLSSNFTTIAAENVSVTQGIGTTTWQVSSALNNLTTYYWRVRAYDGIAYSNWSSGPRSFYVSQAGGNRPPTTPTCNSPASGGRVSDLTPDLIVNNATDPDGNPLSYQFELYNITLTTLISQSPMIAGGGGGVTTWTVPVTLSQKTKYYWRARAYDLQAWSSWMTLANFRTNRPPSVPIPRSPLNKDTVVGSFHVLVTNNSVDLDDDTLTYDFRVFSDSALTKQVEYGIFIDEGHPYTSYTTTGVYQNNKPYYWRVRSYDGAVWCNWSDPQQFWHLDMLLDAQDAPSLISPANGAVEMNAKPVFQIAWSGSNPSSVCFFELATDPDFSAIIDGGTVVGESGAAQWTPNRPLDNGKTYYWRARRDGSGFSDAASFTVDAAVFVSPNPFSYLDGEITIHNLPAGSSLEVYTPSGEKVIRIDDLSGDYHWNVLNSAGEKLGSGVYLYYVRFGSATVADKFIVVR